MSTTNEFDLDQTDRLLTTTRAVRKRLDLLRPVARELILQCIEVSTQAPAAANFQRWRWMVVDEPATKRALADVYRRSFAEYMAAQRAAAGDTLTPQAAAMIDSSQHLADVLGDVPAIVIPCQLGEQPSGLSDVAAYFGSILPAVWSFMLAARSRGLGTSWTTVHLDRDGEVRDLLGIPASVTQVALTPIAYYRGSTFRPAARRPAIDVTYFNRWKVPIGEAG